MLKFGRYIFTKSGTLMYSKYSTSEKQFLPTVLVKAFPSWWWADKYAENFAKLIGSEK